MNVFKYSKDKQKLESVLRRSKINLAKASSVSQKILEDVKADGDSALFKYTKKFDKFGLNKKNIRVPRGELRKLADRVDKKLLQALKHAHKNIKKYHTQQFRNVKKNWNTLVEPGVKVGEKTSAIDSVGCYVPGGRASYPSTVLMTCVPAKVAGVKRIAVASPPPIEDSILAACKVCGVNEVYQLGGAQAIAALAYGTESVKAVSKIVGPGNKYVLSAKNLVYGIVDVDMPAGPSEVLIVADDTADADFVAADLWAQAEHDPDAQCVLVTHSRKLLNAVKRRAPAKSVAVLTENLGECVRFANDYAPEHLEVLTKNPRGVAGRIVNAGAVFIGPYSSVAAGDYASGGNHVLPTGGAARFSSPLGVRDFLKTSCVQEISELGLKKLGTTIQTLAEAEKLYRHKKSVEKRLD